MTVYPTKTKFISNLNNTGANQNNSTESNDVSSGSSNVSGGGAGGGAVKSNSGDKKGTNIPINKKN